MVQNYTYCTKSNSWFWQYCTLIIYIVEQTGYGVQGDFSVLLLQLQVAMEHYLKTKYKHNY